MKHIVLMGLRSTYELDYIKKKVDKVDIISVRSPFETRFNRLKKRIVYAACIKIHYYMALLISEKVCFLKIGYTVQEN